MRKHGLHAPTAYIATGLFVLLPTVSLLAGVFNPLYLPPWREFQQGEGRLGRGVTTLAGSPSLTSLATGSFYGGSALSAGPDDTSVNWKGHVVFGDTSGVLRSINFASGPQSSWNVTLGGAIYSTPAIGNLLYFDDVFVGCDDYSLYRYNKTGTFRASYATGGMVRSSPVLDESNSLILVGSDDNKVYALTVQNSPSYGFAVAWSYTTGDDVRSSPAIDIANDLVFVGSNDDKLYCLRETSGRFHTAGSLYWSYTTGGDIQGSPMWSAINGRVYCGSADGKVYAFLANGTLSWTANLGTAIYSSPALSADNATVYIGCDDDKVYALNATTGAVNWSYTTSGDVRSAPAVLNDGRIAIGSDDGNLYVLNANGSLSSSHSAGSAVRSSPSVGHPTTLSGSTGPVFFGSTGGNLYLLQ